MRLSKRPRRTKRLRIYYTGDIHGSDLCFRKFLNAADAYSAQVLVLGGDLGGKAMVPIVLNGSGTYEAEFLGERVMLTGEQDFAEFERKIRYNGLYPLTITGEERDELDASEELRDKAFQRLLREQLRDWMHLADERLADRGLVCAVMLGNDDDPSLVEEIETSAVVVNPEGRVVDLGEGYTMISSGYSNVTPWRSPRELSENELAEQLERFVAQANGSGRLIFNLHCPPYASGLDAAQQLDGEFRPVYEGGNPIMIPAGSTAVRDAIVAHQPVLSLHGHIHEARAARRLGNTLAINPGSDYSSGQLQGVIVDMAEDSVVHYVFTRG